MTTGKVLCTNRKAFAGKLTVVAALVAVSGVCLADSHTWKSTGRVNDWDWNESGNFLEGVAPEAGDTVKLPASTDIFVTNAASFELVSSLDQVFPVNAESRIVFVVEDGETYSIANCAICSAEKHGSSSESTGAIVKRGTGTLILARADGYPEQNDRAPSYTDRNAYKTKIIVEEGVLKLPTTAETGGYTHGFGHISVSNNATLFTVSGGNYTSPTAIWGEGVITNTDAAARLLRVNGGASDVCVFRGTIGGSIAYESYGNVTLLGTNTFSGNLTAYCDTVLNLDNLSANKSRTAFAKVGKTNTPGAVPDSKTELLFGSKGGRYAYIGDSADETDRKFTASYPREGPCVIDGGHHGELTLTGAFGTTTSAGRLGMTMLGLAGSNEFPCVIAGDVNQTAGTNDFFFVKVGSGAWRFTEKARTFNTTVTVKEGTLQFDSLAEAGVRCSLGTATNLSAAYYGGHRSTYATNYAFLAGATLTAPAVLEYTGTNLGVSVATRPIGLIGNLSLKNDTSLPWRHSGFGNATDKAVTLDLTGAGTAENMAQGIFDTAAAPISVTKSGSGTWVLDGSNTIHGAVTVKGGTLKVRKAGGNYTWFRWTIRGTWASSTGGIYLKELGLYDSSGNKVNASLSTDNANWLALEPGQCAFGRRGVVENKPLAKAMDGTTAYLEYYVSGSVPTPGNASTWLPIVMRVRDGAAAAETYDLNVAHSYNSGSDAKRSPKSWQMEGSVDGIHWDLLSETNNAQPVASMWVGCGTTYEGDSKDLPHTGGLPLAKTSVDIATTVFDSVSTVSVATNCTLETSDGITIKTLTLDAGGNGTIKGFAFAEKGTLDVANLPSGVREVAFDATFIDVTGLKNLSDWTLTIDGDKAASRYISVSNDGVVRLVPKGLTIILK